MRARLQLFGISSMLMCAGLTICPGTGAQKNKRKKAAAIDQYGGQQRDFISEFAPKSRRYIKVKAYTIGNTPEWHPGAGRPASILIEEIVVE